jgi:hypothetical protein
VPFSFEWHPRIVSKQRNVLANGMNEVDQPSTVVDCSVATYNSDELLVQCPELIAEPDLTSFGIKRVFWIYGVPDGLTRGIHAHHQSLELLQVARGRVLIKVITLDGREQSFQLDSTSQMLLLPPYTMKTITFLQDALLVVFTSSAYDPAD